jgi:allophanate hydrolase subunit 2
MIFRQPAVIALCGAPFEFALDGKPASMWTRHVVAKGTEVTVGSRTSEGSRAYLAVLGGFPNM